VNSFSENSNENVETHGRASQNNRNHENVETHGHASKNRIIQNIEKTHDNSKMHDLKTHGSASLRKRCKNKYRIESARLKNWDYSSNGYYFITICSQHRINWFGEIVNGKMNLSDFGKIVNEQWYKSFEIRDELISGEFVIMPNHIHAIVIIQYPVETYGRTSKNNKIQNIDKIHDNSKMHDLKTYGRTSKNNETQNTEKSHENTITHDDKKTHVRASLRREPKSISSFVAGFKSATINEIDNLIDSQKINISKFNRNNHLWQPRFYDHIIKNENELLKISQYIQDNPLNWEKDDLYFK